MTALSISDRMKIDDDDLYGILADLEKSQEVESVLEQSASLGEPEASRRVYHLNEGVGDFGISETANEHLSNLTTAVFICLVIFAITRI